MVLFQISIFRRAGIWASSLALFALSSCATVEHKPGVYQDKRVTFSYPEGWTARKDFGGVIFVESGPMESGILFVQPVRRGTEGELSTFARDFSRRAAGGIFGMGRMVPGSNHFSATKDTGGGGLRITESLRITSFRGVTLGLIRSYRSYIAPEYSFRVFTQVSEGDRSKTEPEFDAIIKSMVFAPVGKPKPLPTQRGACEDPFIVGMVPTSKWEDRDTIAARNGSTSRDSARQESAKGKSTDRTKVK